LSGKLLNVPYTVDPVFGFSVPQQCDGVPESILNPSGSWPDKNEYMRRYKELATRFVENFKKYEEGCPAEVKAAGPRK
jgi:phosphoenolpyruvate carboxykinase (ATP)